RVDGDRVRDLRPLTRYGSRSCSASFLARAEAARSAWNAATRAVSVASEVASMRTAGNPALRAPPLATDATGTPAGIWTIDSSESSPSNVDSGTGTPITGS